MSRIASRLVLGVAVLSACAAALLSACSSSIDEGPGAEPPVTPVVATLLLRDRRLTISSTPSGVRYEVADAVSTRSQLSLEELEAFAPELGELVRTASARRQPALDARLDPLPPARAVADGVWAGRALR
jgi:hypothetical protein